MGRDMERKEEKSGEGNPDTASSGDSPTTSKAKTRSLDYCRAFLGMPMWQVTGRGFSNGYCFIKEL